jgi:chromosomal replication initiation ATPase DnaA
MTQLDRQIEINQQRLLRLYAKKQTEVEFRTLVDYERIITIINSVVGVDITKRTRFKWYVIGRTFFYKIMRERTDRSLKNISALLINQDHATLIHHLQDFENRYSYEKDFRKAYDEVEKRIETINQVATL